jgi:hypothetical protein
VIPNFNLWSGGAPRVVTVRVTGRETRHEGRRAIPCWVVESDALTDWGLSQTYWVSRAERRTIRIASRSARGRESFETFSAR